MLVMFLPPESRPVPCLVAVPRAMSSEECGNGSGRSSTALTRANIVRLTAMPMDKVATAIRSGVGDRLNVRAADRRTSKAISAIPLLRESIHGKSPMHASSVAGREIFCPPQFRVGSPPTPGSVYSALLVVQQRGIGSRRLGEISTVKLASVHECLRSTDHNVPRFDMQRPPENNCQSNLCVYTLMQRNQAC